MSDIRGYQAFLDRKRERLHDLAKDRERCAHCGCLIDRKTQRCWACKSTDVRPLKQRSLLEETI